MHIAIAAVMSADAKLTRHSESDIYKWVSDEDQEHFYGLLRRHDTIVMGRGTYQSVKDKIQLSPDKLRTVLTTHPEQYADQTVASQLEFVHATPARLVDNLQNRGFENLLVVGGSQIISDFLAARLASELYLTIEPRLFGSGQPLLAAVPLDVELQLLNQRQLNERGTMLLKYRVL